MNGYHITPEGDRKQKSSVVFCETKQRYTFMSRLTNPGVQAAQYRFRISSLVPNNILCLSWVQLRRETTVNCKAGWQLGGRQLIDQTVLLSFIVQWNVLWTNYQLIDAALLFLLCVRVRVGVTACVCVSVYVYMCMCVCTVPCIRCTTFYKILVGCQWKCCVRVTSGCTCIRAVHTHTHNMTRYVRTVLHVRVRWVPASTLCCLYLYCYAIGIALLEKRLESPMGLYRVNPMTDTESL